MADDQPINTPDSDTYQPTIDEGSAMALSTSTIRKLP